MNDADSAGSPGSPSDPGRNVRIPRPLHGSVLILLALASSSAYLTRHCLAVANTTIQKELDLNSEQMGYVFSLFALGYMIFQIPGGVVGLRIGTRNALPLFSVLWSVITVWSSLVYSLVPLLASRLTFGLAQAGLVPNTAQVIKDWFPSRWQGSVSSMIGVAMSLGGAMTFWLTGVLIEFMHWRSIFQIYSLVGIAWAIAFWLVFRTRPEEHPLVESGPQTGDSLDSEDDPTTETLPDVIAGIEKNRDDDLAGPNQLGLWRLMAHSSILWMCVQAPFRAAGYNLFVTFFPEFLERAHGLSPTEAGKMATWPFVGVIVGGLLGGQLIDLVQRKTGNRTLSRIGVAFFSLTITTALTIAAAFATTPSQLLWLITLGAGFSGIASPAVWCGLIDLGGRKAAVVSGASNMIGCLAGVAFTPLVGILVDAIKINGSGWDLLILVHAGFYGCSALAFSVVRIPDRPVTETETSDESDRDKRPTPFEDADG